MGKTPEQIRKTLKIPIDYTQEEVKEIWTENQWAFEREEVEEICRENQWTFE